MELVEILKELSLLGFLFIAAWVDYRKKELPVWLLISGGATGIIFQIIDRKTSVGSILLGCLLGVMFLAIGKITRQAVGYGDGLMLVTTGCFLGLERNVFLLLFGLLVAAVFSIGVLIFRKKEKKDEIPFAPFLFGGYVILLAL